MRLNKFIAHSGYCSRRNADQLIFSGRVQVNGTIIKEPGYTVNNSDHIQINGKKIELETQNIYYMLHKPVGYTSSVSDPHAKRVVLDLFPNMEERIYPVGRLDRDSRGLLLLTNDGDFTYHLTHPKHELYKKYQVRVKGKPDEKEIKKLREGIIIDGYKTNPARIKINGPVKDGMEYIVEINEGRNRQIRKMFQKIGTEVYDLKRIAIGAVNLGNLPEGKYRVLTKEEVKCLKGGMQHVSCNNG